MNRPFSEVSAIVFSKENFLTHVWIREYMQFALEKGNLLNAVESCYYQLDHKYKGLKYLEFKTIFDEVFEDFKSGKPVWPEPVLVDNCSEGSKDKDVDSEKINKEEKPENKKSFSVENSIDKFSIRTSFMEKAPETRWLVENIIEEGKICSFVAPGGVGKTWIGIDLSLRLACSKPSNFFGFPIAEQCLVFFVTVEDTEDAIRRRLDIIDPEFEFRANAQETLFILTAAQAFNGHFSLVEYSSNRSTQLTAKYKWLISEIKEKSSSHSELPIVVIFDTYSATHHGDENTTIGATEWFRAVSLLSTTVNATVIVMHHIRKVGYNEPLRNPDDFAMAIRGSNAFVNSCRTVFGIWAIKDSEAKKLINNRTALYNFSVIKDNNSPDWKDRDIGIFSRPTMTLMRHEKGYLTFDAEINKRRKDLHIDKSVLSEEAESILQEHLCEVIFSYSAIGYPLSRSVFDKQEGYASILSENLRKIPPKTIKASLQFLIENKKIAVAQIRINNKQCEVYDSPNGDYAEGRADRRTLPQMPPSPFQ
ncbi:MAG: AAA family ATPase [Micavibrio sp.]|nr:AAA family ATPase [Micavibrio sp.]